MHVALELFEVIWSTLFEFFHAFWRCRTDRHTDYPPGRTRPGAVSLCYDTFAQKNWSCTLVEGRRRLTRSVPEGIPNWWEHLKDEGQWMPRDASFDYFGVLNPNANITRGAAVMVVEPMLT